MSRAAPNTADGYDGINMPDTGPRQMGQDGDNPAFVTYLNGTLDAMATMHDDGTPVRPSYIKPNSLWAYTDSQGAKSIYQFNGAQDVLLWTISNTGVVSIRGVAFSDDLDGTRGADSRVAATEKAVGQVNAKANQALALAQNGGVPSGCILLWSGNPANIPTGWALCNGQNNTPNLTDRFIIGAGSTYGVGATGGAATHTHTLTVAGTTLTTAQMPSHAHSGIITTTAQQYVSGAYRYGDTGGSIWNFPAGNTGAAGGGGSHTHTSSAAAGTNLPPYYALCYIMKR